MKPQTFVFLRDINSRRKKEEKDNGAGKYGEEATNNDGGRLIKYYMASKWTIIRGFRIHNKLRSNQKYIINY